MASFVTIDFETANGDMASICQVGVVTYENGKETDRFSSLVNPEEPFWHANVAVHGIRPEAVRSAPKLPDLYDNLRRQLADRYVISHGWFDKHCLSRVLDKYQLPDFDRHWLDATRLVRRALPQFSQRGYGLQNVAAHYGLRTIAHDALNDAQTCGTIVLNILAETGTTLDDWVYLMEHPVRLMKRPKRQLDVKPNENGQHFGQSVVFTGELSIPRDEAQLLASKAGFNIKSGVSRKVDYLVCGERDPRLLAGHPESSKERKARELINNGHQIRLIKESDFLRMCEVRK